MGVPSGGGTSLGTAQGRIVIDTSGVRRAQNEVKSASKIMGDAFGALGVAYGAAQIARFSVDSLKLATSYERQSVAARSLAGGQGQLNDLLATYNRVTGGAIDNASALSDVTRLMAVGFADTSEELERFARAARGISIATGQQQDYVISQLQLAIANQSTLRLDQLGLGVAEVKQRIDELKAANSGLTTEMAYQQAILGLAEEKFGEITDSAVGAATGLEKFLKAWKEFQLNFGQGATAPGNMIFSQWAKDIEDMNRQMQQFNRLLRDAEMAGKIFRFNIGLSNAPEGMAGPPIGPQIRPPAARSGPRPTPAPGLTDEQKALLDAQVEYNRELADIARDSGQAIQDATEQYSRQRAETIRQYELGIAREAEDFARARARQQRDYERNILEIARDAREREAEWAADLGEQTAEVRQRSNERIAEMEADFAKRRERAQADHRDRLMDAASRLDAEAIYREQRDFARGQKEAEEDRNERLDKERKNLQESLDQAQKAHNERLEDARKADAKRLEDMRIALAQQRADEDEDRRIQKERAAADHEQTLAQQATDHQLNLARIAREAHDQRTALTTAFRDQLNDLGLHNVAYRAEQIRAQNQAIEDLKPFMQNWFNTAREAMEATFPNHPSNNDPYINRPLPNRLISSGSIGRGSVTIAPGAVVVYGAIGQSEESIGRIVVEKITSILEQLNN